jgi:hypothetical protein
MGWIESFYPWFLRYFDQCARTPSSNRFSGYFFEVCWCTLQLINHSQNLNHLRLVYLVYLELLWANLVYWQYSCLVSCSSSFTRRGKVENMRYLWKVFCTRLAATLDMAPDSKSFLILCILCSKYQQTNHSFFQLI